MKRIICIVLCIVLALSCAAFAAEMVTRAKVTLSFSGTTANCSGSVTDAGKYIDATLELLQGSTSIDSWSMSGTSAVSVSDTATVSHGVTYTLRISGTSGGVSFTPVEVTKTCP